MYGCQQHGVPRLPGGKKDEEKLAVLFLALGFVVEIHQNLAGSEKKFLHNKLYGAEQYSGAVCFKPWHISQ